MFTELCKKIERQNFFTCSRSCCPLEIWIYFLNCVFIEAAQVFKNLETKVSTSVESESMFNAYSSSQTSRGISEVDVFKQNALYVTNQEAF